MVNNHFSYCCEEGRQGFTEPSQSFDWVKIDKDIKAAVEWYKKENAMLVNKYLSGLISFDDYIILSKEKYDKAFEAVMEK